MDSTRALQDPRLDGVTHHVVRHGRVGSLAEAAELRGVEPSAVIKTMIVRRSDNDYVFVLVPGDRVIDWAKLRAFLGERRLSLPDADEARTVSGYERGTITPFGADRALDVIADDRIGPGPVSIGGGAHGVSITIDGTSLVRILEASSTDVTKPE